MIEPLKGVNDENRLAPRILSHRNPAMFMNAVFLVPNSQRQWIAKDLRSRFEMHPVLVGVHA